MRGAHAGHLSLARDLEALDEHLSLVWRLDQAQIRQHPGRVDGCKPDVPLPDPPDKILRPAQRVVHAAGLEGEGNLRPPRGKRVEKGGRFLVVDSA